MSRVLPVVVIAVVLSAGPAAAGPEDVANGIASEIMSPFCAGVTLHDCPSDAAVDLRDRIETKAAAGWSRARIMSWLENQYGPSINGAPSTEGTGWLAWALPAAALIALAAVAGTFLRRATRRREGSPPRSTISSEDRLRLDRELSALRRET